MFTLCYTLLLDSILDYLHYLFLYYYAFTDVIPNYRMFLLPQTKVMTIYKKIIDFVCILLNNNK